MPIKKFLTIPLIILSLLSSFYLGTCYGKYHAARAGATNNQRSNLISDTSTPFIDNNVWESYQKNLEKFCPYYEPDGVTYRNCLTDLLAAREKNLSDLFNKLNTELPAAKQRAEVQGYGVHIYDDLGKQLEQLNALNKPYRDKLCEVKTQIYAEGSGYGGFLAVCKIYEADKLTNLLEQLEGEDIKSNE